jgi:hypothetical protein
VLGRHAMGGGPGAGGAGGIRAPRVREGEDDRGSEGDK